MLMADPLTVRVRWWAPYEGLRPFRGDAVFAPYWFHCSGLLCMRFTGFCGLCPRHGVANR